MSAYYARGAVGGFLVVSLWIVLNALYRQDGSAALPSVRADATGGAVRPLAAAAPVSPETPVISAIRRELQLRGYTVGESEGATLDLRLAILAFQFDAGFPMTGEADAVTLKTILFSVAAKANPAEPIARLEASPALVRQVQGALRKLGYAESPADGVANAAWRSAIERFESERGLPVTGTVSYRMLLEIILLTGSNLQVAG